MPRLTVALSMVPVSLSTRCSRSSPTLRLRLAPFGPPFWTWPASKLRTPQWTERARRTVISRANLLARRRSAIRIDGKTSYGLGLMLTEQQELAQVTHGGNTLGFSADMVFFPEHGIGMVVLSNLLSAVGQRLIEILRTGRDAHGIASFSIQDSLYVRRGVRARSDSWVNSPKLHDDLGNGPLSVHAKRADKISVYTNKPVPFELTI